MRRPLPDYPVAGVKTGQRFPFGERAREWSASVSLPPDEDSLKNLAREYRRLSEGGEPLVRSEFDVYADGGALVWLKSPCAADDARGRFLLSVFPRNPEDLPSEFRELGHESRNFDFAWRGARFGGKCMARVALPDYPIREIEVGQWIPGGATLWRARAGIGSRGTSHRLTRRVYATRL